LNKKTLYYNFVESKRFPNLKGGSMKKLIRYLALPMSCSLLPLFAFTTAGAVSNNALQGGNIPSSQIQHVQGGTLQGGKGQYLENNQGQYKEYRYGGVRYGGMQEQQAPQGRYKGEPGLIRGGQGLQGQQGQLTRGYNGGNWGYGGEWRHGYQGYGQQGYGQQGGWSSGGNWHHGARCFWHEGSKYCCIWHHGYKYCRGA
jgi:hypothetical protein